MRFASVVLLLICAVGVVGCGSIRPPRGVTPVERAMTVTGYCKCGQCCGWHRTWYGMPVYSSGPSRGKRKAVGITASGVKARPGTIAADTSRYPFGTVMYVPGYGYGVVEDRGGAIRGDHIDLYFTSHTRALEWGRRRLTVLVWLPAR
jgi:3D (Asp-Asp-Asp) domain-containing protein